MTTDMSKVTVKQLMDAAIKKATMRGSNDIAMVSTNTVKAFLEAQRPNCYILYSAGWRNGYCVNGINP
jgi:hypothetical protein